MPLNTMTPVLRDAIVVCRSLRIKYLWIDSLCILQDDLDDWSKESEVMGLIYYYACFTICPLASRSCLRGFLEPRPPGIQIRFHSSIRPSIEGTISLYESHNDRDISDLRGREKADSGFDLEAPRNLDLSLAAWGTRGWTFQEESCSFRMLYFGQNMIHFTCPSWSCSEDGFVTSSEGVQGPFRELIDLSISSGPGNSEDAAMATWETPAFRARLTWQYVSTIVQRSFTYRNDILPALAGLATAAGKLQNDRYLAGLWETSLHFDLLWYIPTPEIGSLDATVAECKADRPYVSPSWSWVSCKSYIEHLAPLNYSIPSADGSNSTQKMFTKCLTRPSHLRREMELVGSTIEPEEKSHYGRLKFASLQVCGRTIPVPKGAVMHPAKVGRPPAAYFADMLGSLFLDWCVSQEEPLQSEDMVLLLTTSCCQATSNEVLRFLANPDEDHTKGLGERAVHLDRKGLEVSREEAIDEAETCMSCLDNGQPRNAWGLVLCPVKNRENCYYRVGVFVMFGHMNALQLFQAACLREIQIL
jgi:hypothetical protein